MPSPIAFSHRLLIHLQNVRKAGTIPYLRPDAKAQVSVRYQNGKPDRITAVVISHQTEEVSLDEIRRDLIREAERVLSISATTHIPSANTNNRLGSHKMRNMTMPAKSLGKIPFRGTLIVLGGKPPLSSEERSKRQQMQRMLAAQAEELELHREEILGPSSSPTTPDKKDSES